ncbi:MAG: glutamine-hydrolyzing GMP synthase [Bacteroidales bacterium]|nr:glutamine-hydrolyzing GMP synthase [Bacteroidales bacterium]
MNEIIIILDFGSQYTQLIARKIRELNVYCEIQHYDQILAPDKKIKGIVMSGSPFSVRDDNAPKPDLTKILGEIPVLGICYGAQLIAQLNGGEVMPSKSREYGRANLHSIDTSNKLFQNVEPGTQVWMSHGDTIINLPDGYDIIASTKDIDVGAFRALDTETYGLQFHPEVYHSTHGKQILQNFLVDICGCSQSWTPDSFIETAILDIKAQVGDENIVLGLSGGVDSSVTAMLLHKAVGQQLTSIFVDNGLLRKNEFTDVLAKYQELGLRVLGIDAGKRFLAALKGISDPEKKRKTIGRVFIEVFEEESKKIPGVGWLAQGTIYPDVIESVSVKGPSAKIKSHHNVGGLPEKMNLKVLEPMKLLFKDEVRRVGKSIGLDDQIMRRHPFPGPGLAVRILGDITEEKVAVLQEADNIFINGLEENGLYDQVWQAGVVLLPVQSVGVMGDERTYEHVVALRAVTSTDGMTADWAHLPYDFLSMVSNRIINNVKGINRVVYDVSSKPPATIEWE